MVAKLETCIDNRSVAINVSTHLLLVDCDPQACCKLFQQVVTSTLMQTSRCIKFDFKRLPAQQLNENDRFLQIVDQLNQVKSSSWLVAFLAVY